MNIHRLRYGNSTVITSKPGEPDGLQKRKYGTGKISFGTVLMSDKISFSDFAPQGNTFSRLEYSG